MAEVEPRPWVGNSTKNPQVYQVPVTKLDIEEKDREKINNL